MKIDSQDTINIGDVSRHGNLRLDSLFNMFQEMAILHTHRVGIELKDLFESRKTWMLNRVAADITKLPRLEETVETATWSRKIHRFKGIRDFEIFAGGESIIRATSLWVYFDARRGRPVRAPDYFEDKYGVVADQATDVDIESIGFAEITRPDLSIPIATRISDYDINGHANNAAILQYIETGIYRFAPEESRIERIQLVFQHEIPFNIDQVDVQIERTDSGCLFEVSDRETIFVRGAVSINSMAP